jgi:hypothetical protein
MGLRQAAKAGFAAKRGLLVPPIKENDPDDMPETGRRMAEQRRGNLELVRRSGQYRRILQAYLASGVFRPNLAWANEKADGIGIRIRP